MRDIHKIFAIAAATVFLMTAGLLATTSEESDAYIFGNAVEIRLNSSTTDVVIDVYAQDGNEWVLGATVRFDYDYGSRGMDVYITGYENYGTLYNGFVADYEHSYDKPGNYMGQWNGPYDGTEHFSRHYDNLSGYYNFCAMFDTMAGYGPVSKMVVSNEDDLRMGDVKYTVYTEVAFNANGGSGTPSTPVTNSYTSETSDNLADVSMQIPTTVPTRDGYTFKGYSYSSSGSLVLTKEQVEAGASLDVPAGMEVTLYAQWEEQSYTVNFLRSEGEVIDSVSVKGGQTVPIPEEPTAPEGYFFVGWYTDNTHSTPFDFSKVITADTNVYAYFEEELYFTSEPQALYTVTKIAGVDNTYVFQVLEESNSTTVHWDFGDGDTSDKRFVSHYFDEPGTYSVTLTVYNSQGEATDTFDVVIPADDESGSDLLLYMAVGLIAVVVVAVVVTRFI